MCRLQKQKKISGRGRAADDRGKKENQIMHGKKE